jgi:error-prone DNA polymerase
MTWALDEPPDVDLENERREEVIQWIYRTYSRERAAFCATVTRYEAKRAIRALGKALGLPEDMIKSLSSGMSSWSKRLSGCRYPEQVENTKCVAIFHPNVHALEEHWRT